MYGKTLIVITLSLLALTSLSAQAQQFEVVHRINFEDAAGAKAAMDDLFKDNAMKGAKATLYARDVGDSDSTHLIVTDFDSYSDRVSVNQKRRESHGWARYLLATQDSEYLGGNMVTVVDDHGKPRHTAGYLAAFLIHTTDAATYRDAIKELNDAIGNPGVLRLVAMRSGGRAVTHAVLIGGDDFTAVNKYIDKLYASEAFAAFTRKVGDSRKVVGVDMYRRIGAWGY